MTPVRLVEDRMDQVDQEGPGAGRTPHVTGSGEAAPGTRPTLTTGGQPAYFTCWDIHAYYGESYIVQGVSFDGREGEIVALLGRNGAGKTSTLRAIARLADPALKHGEIWLDHKPLHEMKAFEAAQIGVGLYRKTAGLFRASPSRKT